MTQLLDATYFKALSPTSDKHLPQTWVPPAILSALLNPESSLVAAPSGYGKSTLVWIAQQQLQNDWLNVNLANSQHVDDDFMTTLLRQITTEMWRVIQHNPAMLAKFQTRAVAARYFLDLFSDVDVDFLLTCLAEDFPEHREIVQTFQSLQPKPLFSPTAAATQKLSILCDCVQKLEIRGVFIWIDLSAELEKLSLPVLSLLENLFDSLYLMRRSILHVKCLAPPSICQHLLQLRGVETLSVATLELTWRAEALRSLIEQRLKLASQQQIQSLSELIDLNRYTALLQDSSDAGSPIEWLALMQIVAETVNQQPLAPLTDENWLAIQRRYYAGQVKIRMDQQGSFWRGNRLLAELTPKKRAIYPLVQYLYENPGVHRTYSLLKKMDIDEPNLNTIISRARKEHIEPLATSETDESWIYLVTDFKGGGYELRHTDRSP